METRFAGGPAVVTRAAAPKTTAGTLSGTTRVSVGRHRTDFYAPYPLRRLWWQDLCF